VVPKPRANDGATVASGEVEPTELTCSAKLCSMQDVLIELVQTGFQILLSVCLLPESVVSRSHDRDGVSGRRSCFDESWTPPGGIEIKSAISHRQSPICGYPFALSLSILQCGKFIRMLQKDIRKSAIGDG
jgi:hypothetical protein